MGAKEQRNGATRRAIAHRNCLTDHNRRTRMAWEQFVSGDDNVAGISPSILLSWYRCRDLYRVDPRLSGPPRAAGRGCSTLAHNGVFAQLGGIAAALVERSGDCLSTVTDGDGRILAMWGGGPSARKGRESDLAPFFSWSEAAVGTNGMGTALRESGLMAIYGPEHWCQVLHDWYCIGVAIYDSVTHDPVAALNVSSFDHDVPIDPTALTEKTDVLRRELRDRAVRDATEVLRQFAETARRASGALLAVDVAGNVIAANEAARAFFTDLPEGPVLDPAQRHRDTCPELRMVARKSAERARGEPDWAGGADLGFLVGEDSKMFSIAAVRSPDDVIGLLLAEDAANRDTEKVDDEPTPIEVANLPKRIPAVRAERIVLLPPEEIRYAVAARHDVWFITDRGRVRAATHGIDNVERELAPFGFMRVHRSYVVNLGRIREVGERPNGALTLSTDLQRQEAIAVSRRCAIKLRQQLGF